MKRNKLLLLLALLMTAATGAWAQEQWDVVWDFTAWSTETVTALKADAAASNLEGWSDIEKAADAEAGADPTEASKDNCFWSVAEPNADGSLSANGVVIKEFKGLIWNKAYTIKRSLAIAVNYPTALSDYAGPAYLWLGGGKNKIPCFTIPGVKGGSTITMEVESHKASDARGVELYTGVDADGLVDAATKIGDTFAPKTKESHTWEIAEDCNVVVYNTNNCHIYTIKVKAPAAAAASGYTVSLKDGVKDADKWTVKVGEGQAQALPIGGLKGDGSETVTLQYNGRLKVKGVKATSDAAPAAPKALAEATLEDIGKIAGKDGNIYATIADAEAVATGNAVAMIAYVGTASDCAHGLAIALADESVWKEYEAAGTACSSKAAVTGGTWRLPSVKDWQYMFIGCGASGSYSVNPTSMSYSGLASKLTTAQGDALQTDFYWSSTEEPGDLAWYVYFVGGSGNFSYEDENNEYLVRACLAF